MALFGKKEEGQNPPPSGPPTDLVLRMRNQGYSNNQIVQTLQREGYKSHDIFDAMNQADIKGSVKPVPGDTVSEMPSPENPMQMKEEPARPPSFAPPTTTQPISRSPMRAPANSAPMSEDKERMEEIVETLIEEKWEQLAGEMKKVVDWKDKTENRMLKLEQNFTSLKENFDKLHSGILGKISEYDEGLTNVGTEIKALEKVFQKILPTLTENVNELSRITKDIKKK